MKNRKTQQITAGAAIAAALLTSTGAPVAASEAEARELAVQAEQARRQAGCDILLLENGNPLTLAGVLLGGENLRPSIAMLTHPHELDADGREDLKTCLSGLHQAALLEKQIFADHSDTRVAFQLSLSDRPSAKLIEWLQARLEESIAEIAGGKDAAERARRAYKLLNSAEEEHEYIEQQRRHLNSLIENQGSTDEPPSR